MNRRGLLYNYTLLSLTQSSQYMINVMTKSVCRSHGKCGYL